MVKSVTVPGKCYAISDSDRQDNPFLLHNETKMMLLESIATNDMIRYVSMYTEVWFLDCTAGE